jgi:AcrR family transcriptional regulator
MPDRFKNQRRSPMQARSRATYDAILEAASQILERGGADALNTNDVAERAGVSIGTLYQYFPDKHAILLAAAKRDLVGDVTPLLRRQRALIQALIGIVEKIGGFGAEAGSRTAPARVSDSPQVGARKRRRRPMWESERVDLVPQLLIDLFEPARPALTPIRIKTHRR